MKKKINVFEPSLKEEVLDNLKNIFDSRWLGRGALVTEFESKLKVFMKTENMSTISCASDAIFGAFKIFNFPVNSKIAIPVNSFPAVGSAIIANNLIPIFVDIEPQTGNIDINSLISLKDIGLSAVFITHYGGVPVNITSIREAFDDDFKILEDSACALGTLVDNQNIGNNSDFSCWSFDAMKLITCGEGGAFSFKDINLHNKAREYFYLGLPHSEKSGLDKSNSGEIWWNYEITQAGVRSVFTNINAAIGMPGINSIESKLSHLTKLRQRYESNLKGKINFVLQNKVNIQYSNYFFTIFSNNRDGLAKFLLENNVYSTLRYARLDNMELFKKDLNSEEELFPGADQFYSRALNVPIHANLSLKEIDYISKKILEYEI